MAGSFLRWDCTIIKMAPRLNVERPNVKQLNVKRLKIEFCNIERLEIDVERRNLVRLG
jgi:hypothetical protein